MLKKKLSFILVSIVFLSLIVSISALSLSQGEKSAINLCKKECSQDKKIEIKLCSSHYKESIYACNNLTNYNDKKECKKQVILQRKECIKESNIEYTRCRKDCPFKITNQNATCILDENVYNASQKFQNNNCEICRCNYDGKLSCKKIQNCGFTNFSISESSCISSGGLYQRLCNGPYFGQKCSVKTFCQCEGINNYSCPQDTICLKNFTIPDIPIIIDGWTDTSGNPLGNIGICAQKENIETCGNGVCENIATSSNQIIENKLNCPQDCL
ncbi:MAG TPA: hypothetical protein VI815_03650 [Candidatus Nanoarchaeia archaeon]|nr:hypothetical protein [Candidatus Nanoarchaeia archaeon]